MRKNRNQKKRTRKIQDGGTKVKVKVIRVGVIHIKVTQGAGVKVTTGIKDTVTIETDHIKMIDTMVTGTVVTGMTIAGTVTVVTEILTAGVEMNGLHIIGLRVVTIDRPILMGIGIGIIIRRTIGKIMRNRTIVITGVNNLTEVTGIILVTVAMNLVVKIMLSRIIGTREHQDMTAGRTQGPKGQTGVMVMVLKQVVIARVLVVLPGRGAVIMNEHGIAGNLTANGMVLWEIIGTSPIILGKMPIKVSRPCQMEARHGAMVASFKTCHQQILIRKMEEIQIFLWTIGRTKIFLQQVPLKKCHQRILIQKIGNIQTILLRTIQKKRRQRILIQNILDLLTFLRNMDKIIRKLPSKKCRQGMLLQTVLLNRG